VMLLSLLKFLRREFHARVLTITDFHQNSSIFYKQISYFCAATYFLRYHQLQLFQRRNYLAGRGCCQQSGVETRKCQQTSACAYKIVKELIEKQCNDRSSMSLKTVSIR
jgi:hypothetical protein